MSGDRPLGQAVGEILGMILLSISQAGQRMAAARERAKAEQKAREAEAASRAQQERWLEEVNRQKARGHAGNASPETARAALGGRGGRPSKLDDRWF